MSRIHHTTLKDPIEVAGVQIRTNNASELSGTGAIAALWQRFFAEDLLSKIPDRTSASLYAVYSNYASDENGDYDYLIGSPVSSIAGLPEGMTFAAIATGNYAVVTTEKGPISAMVPGTWKEIWTMTREELKGRRAFISDYEIYGEHATDPESAEVEIHLGLEPEFE